MRWTGALPSSCPAKRSTSYQKEGNSWCLCIWNISAGALLGMGGCRGRQRKGCELIRFLSLHAPLPVLLLSSSSPPPLLLLLSNPCGQRAAAQRLDSRTQWGNNWYKRQLAADKILSVIQSDTVSSVPPRLHLKELPVWFQSCFIRSSPVVLRSSAGFSRFFPFTNQMMAFSRCLFLSSGALFLFYFFPLNFTNTRSNFPSNTSPRLVSLSVPILPNCASRFRVTCRRMG